jgi:hypothetical protein
MGNCDGETCFQPTITFSIKSPSSSRLQISSRGQSHLHPDARASQTITGELESGAHAESSGPHDYLWLAGPQEL